MNPIDPDDEQRLEALHSLSLLDTAQEERFDRLTRLAAAVLGVPIAVVSLVDRERQWFKSRVGMDMTETPRSISFCTHAVAQRKLMVVPDARADPRFAGNPLVLGEPNIRFYAGQPIFSPDGYAVGTLCAIDTAARTLDATQLRHLSDIALLVEDELARNALRTSNDALKREIRQREQVEATLRRSEERIRTIIDSSFSAFISIDAAGCIVEWNQSAERMFGWLHAEVLGRELADTIIPERFRAGHRAGLTRFTQASARGVLNRRMELPAITRSGNPLTVELTLNAFYLGEDIFFGAFLQDITERLQARRGLEQKQELLNAVLESIDVGVVACGEDGQISLINRAAREFHGMAGTGVEESGWAARYELLAADGEPPLLAQDTPLQRALKGEVVRDAAHVIAAPGRPARSLLASGRPILGASGEALGAVMAMKDVSALKESQRKLALNEERLAAITESLPALIGQVDQHGIITFLNSRAMRYYSGLGVDLIGRHVSTLYSSEGFGSIEPYVRAAMDGRRVSFEDRIRVKGEDLYFQATYIPATAPDGSVNGFYAMSFDITARKNIENRQRESEERLRTITNNLPVLISYLDREGRYQFANTQYRQWYGVAAEAMIGRTMAELFGDAFSAERAAPLRRCLDGHSVEFELEVHLGPVPRIVHSVLIPHWRDARVLGAYWLSTDVTETRRHEAQLKALADTDALTGLPNRRSYETHLVAAVDRSARNGQPLALMYLDIDHFKRVNDTLGHAGGDAVLREFARRLSHSVRKTDLVCRLAGDEFTVVLEGIGSGAECTLVADKIIEAMRSPFRVGAEFWHVSTSIGIAWSGTDIVAHLLSKNADAALYLAKDAGRNRYHLIGRQPDR